MTTRLVEPLRREVEIDGETFTVVVSADGVRISRKRFREGRSITWRALWNSGELEHDAEEPARAARRIQ
jgi:hypothetical protein